MNIKEDSHSFSPSIFTRHGAKKSADHLSITWSSPTLKRMVFIPHEKKRQPDFTNLVAPRSYIHLRVAHHAVYQA